MQPTVLQHFTGVKRASAWNYENRPRRGPSCTSGPVFCVWGPGINPVLAHGKDVREGRVWWEKQVPVLVSIMIVILFLTTPVFIHPTILLGFDDSSPTTRVLISPNLFYFSFSYYFERICMHENVCSEDISIELLECFVYSQ